MEKNHLLTYKNSFQMHYTTFLETNQRLAVVYHQNEVLHIIRNLLRYIIKPQEYAPSVMIYAYGDDIHAKA